MCAVDGQRQEVQSLSVGKHPGVILQASLPKGRPMLVYFYVYRFAWQPKYKGSSQVIFTD